MCSHLSSPAGSTLIGKPSAGSQPTCVMTESLVCCWTCSCREAPDPPPQDMPQNCWDRWRAHLGSPPWEQEHCIAIPQQLVGGQRAGFDCAKALEEGPLGPPPVVFVGQAPGLQYKPPHKLIQRALGCASSVRLWWRAA